MRPHPTQYRDLLEKALHEDLADGYDLTSSLFPEGLTARFVVRSRQPGILAGGFLIRDLARLVDPRITVELDVEDGSSLQASQNIARVQGPLTSILLAERTCLNLLGHLCGVATLTRRFVDAVAGTGARIADTRKTLPGLRVLQKYAVRIGGGTNHRFGLYDMVLLKDNHQAHVESLDAAISRLRASLGHPVKIQVEADTLEQFRCALRAGADAVLLDNMALEDLRTAVAEGKGRIVLEASGGVSIETVRDIALTGVDLISVGRLTHSAPALDIGLDAE